MKSPRLHCNRLPNFIKTEMFPRVLDALLTIASNKLLLAGMPSLTHAERHLYVEGSLS